MLAHPEMLFYGEGSQFHLSRMSGEKLSGCCRCLPRVTSPMSHCHRCRMAHNVYLGKENLSQFILFYFIFQSLTNIRLASISLCG